MIHLSFCVFDEFPTFFINTFYTLVFVRKKCLIFPANGEIGEKWKNSPTFPHRNILLKMFDRIEYMRTYT